MKEFENDQSLRLPENKPLGNNGKKTTAESFGIHLSKEYFNFSAAHFLILPDESCERLHGHNYQVEVMIQSSLAKSGLVYDFQDLKPIIRRVCQELDHCILLPGNNPQLRLDAKIDEQSKQDSIFVSYKDKRYMFPASEVIILAIDNTTVERLAYHFFHRLYEIMKNDFDLDQVMNMNVKVYEARGQSGYFMKDFT